MIIIPYKSFNYGNKTILEFDEYQHSFIYYRVNDCDWLRHLYRSYSDVYNKSRDVSDPTTVQKPSITVSITTLGQVLTWCENKC